MGFRKRTPKTYDVASLYEYAIGALGRRMRTVAEMKRLMRERTSAQPDRDRLIEDVIARLKDQKYLNDSGYAASYSSFRKQNEKFGRARVVQGLKAKGVHSEIITQAVNAAFEDVNEEKLARAFLARKRLSKPTDQKSAAKIFRALLRAGHPSRVAFKILKNWHVEEETLSALDSEAAETPQERDDS